MFILDCLEHCNWKALRLIGCGALLGSYGVKLLSSSDAKKAYTHGTAAVLRMKDEVLKDVTTIRENCSDIAADAREINEKRQAELMRSRSRTRKRSWRLRRPARRIIQRHDHKITETGMTTAAPQEMLLRGGFT